MSFLQWLYRKMNPDADVRHESIVRRLAELDGRIGKLESELASAPPLLVQHADKIVIERVDLSTHLGTLQMETLGGQLNIGVTYHGTPKPDELFPLASAAPAAPSSAAGSSASAADRAPQYRIRPRTTNDRPAK